MTARELVIPGQNRFTISGEGYSTEGEITHVGGSRFDLDPYLLPMALCADAVLDGRRRSLDVRLDGHQACVVSMPATLVGTPAVIACTTSSCVVRDRS